MSELQESGTSCHSQVQNKRSVHNFIGFDKKKKLLHSKNNNYAINIMDIKIFIYMYNYNLQL